MQKGQLLYVRMCIEMRDTDVPTFLLSKKITKERTT